jgi:hypothetical protein
MRELFGTSAAAARTGKKFKAILMRRRLRTDRRNEQARHQDVQLRTATAAGANFGAGDLMFIDEDQGTWISAKT